MANIVSAKDIFAPAFFQTWNDIYYKKVETVSCSGGRGSTKSSAIACAILLRLELARRYALERKALGDRNWQKYLTHAACFRKVAGTLADSCFSQFMWSADKLGLTHKYSFRKTPLSIVRNGTGQKIYFRGLDDPLKARSLRSPFSYIRDLWFEELAEFDNIEEVQDVTRSVQRGGHEFMTFYSYNPPETSSAWVNYSLAKIEAEDPLFRQYKSNYLSVPREWLGDKFFRDAEILRRMNERAYRHIYLGEITGNGGTIFPNVKRCRLTDEQIRRFNNVKWGSDFGLRDPTTLNGMQYDSSLHRLIIFDEVYGSDMTLDEIEHEFKRHHFGTEYIIGDSAAAQLILSLRARGVQIIPVIKGDILSGIKWLQSLTEILIDDVRCPNTYREFVNYEYEKNDAGEFTGRLPDFDNHSIDGVRYGCSRLITSYSAFS